MPATDSTWQPLALDGGLTPVGAFSSAAIAGNLVFVSGQVPQNPETGVIEGDLPFAEQARLMLANLRRVVEAAGAGLEHVVSVTVYLDDITDWAEFNTIYPEFFKPPFPARAVVGAHLEKIRVEATAIAVLPRGSA